MRKKNKILNCVKFVFLGILVLMLIIMISLIVKSRLYPDEIPGLFGYKPLIVASDSMQPSILSGDLVIVKQVDAEELMPGDVIAFKENNGTVTVHRVVDTITSKGEVYFETKGDNRATTDAALTVGENVVGKFSSRIGGLGNFILVIASPLGFAVLLLSTMLLFLIGLAAVNNFERMGKKGRILKREEQPLFYA